MKQIRINIPLTVTHKTQDTVAEPVWLGSLLTRGRLFVRQTIYAMAGSVHVTIVGDQDAVQSMLAEQNDPAALIQRALSALGYVIGDHTKDVEQFSRWIDHLVTFPHSEEALSLWTNAALARLPMTRSVKEAAQNAQDVVIERMRLFPPAPKMGLGDGPPLEERVSVRRRAELAAWREAAKACGFESPEDLSSMKDASFGQFVDKKIVAEWQEATGCKTPHQAKNEFSAYYNTKISFQELAELESKLLSYASEIDALRKAPQTHDPVVVDIEHGAHFALNGQTIGRVYDPERELAKVRAELQSKCREAQTERERADTAEGMYRAECVKRESEVRTEKKRADSLAEELRECDKIISKAREFARLAQHDTKSIVDWCREARAKLATAIVPLPKPEKVEAGQKWAFVMTAKSGEEIGNEYLAGRFNDASCRHFAAFHQDIATGFYLGT